MRDARTKESSFEALIEIYLLEHKFINIASKNFDKDKAIFSDIVIDFIKKTQPQEWGKLETLLGDGTKDQVINDLCKWMDREGSLSTFRHGFKCYGRKLQIAFFKAVHTMNPELEANFANNILGLTRQLYFSAKNNKSVDLCISLNGIPVATVELKNPMTGQTIDHAIKQYKNDRDPREPLFEFKRRSLVHFAVDTEQVFMTTRLAGSATYFLPFNKGYEGGSGNPPVSKGRNYRTAYLWEEVLQRDSLLDILARFIHLQVDEIMTDEGRKVKKETMIFPRYHQLQAVRN